MAYSTKLRRVWTTDTQLLNHYRDGHRSFPNARQWFDLISIALIRLGIFDAQAGAV
jgi:hypothetical protein